MRKSRSRFLERAMSDRTLVLGLFFASLTNVVCLCVYL
jgi:hypothetical protein